MTRDQYFDALAVFQKLCDQQPNLFAPQVPGTEHGEALAEATWGFLEKFAQLKKEKVTG